MSLEYFLDFFESIFYLGLGMSCHKAETDESVLGRNRRRNNGVNKDTFIEKIASDRKCLEVIANKERNNRGRSVTDFNTHLAESFKSKIGEIPKIFLTFGLSLHNFKRFESGCG